MNNNFNKLKNHVFKLKTKQFLRTYFNEFIRFCLFLFALFLFLIFIVMIFKIPGNIISSISLLFAGFCILLISVNVIKIKKMSPLKLSHINSDLEKDFSEIEDRIVNSMSLWKIKEGYRNPVAKTIIERLVDETISLLESIPKGVLSLRILVKNLIWFFVTLIIITCLFIWKPVSFVNAVDEIKSGILEKQTFYLRVIPGDTAVESGDNLTIKIHTNSKSLPHIEITRLDQKYSEDFRSEDDDLYLYEITKIREKIEYRVIARKGRMKSRLYKINIKSPPVAANILLTYHYPSYTGYENKVSSDTDVEALRGTSVIVDVESSSELDNAVLITDDGEITAELVSDNKARGKFVLEDQSFYKVLLKDKQGLIDYDAPRYPIRVVSDQPPSIELITPVDDIKVSPEAKIELSGIARDDVGLDNIYISYHIDIGGRMIKVPVTIITDDKNIKRFSYLWDIGKTDALAGSVITYRVAAEDNNTLYGPGTGYSKTMLLEIIGFRDKHRKVLESAGQIEEKILEMLSDSYDLTSQLEEERFEEGLNKLTSIRDKTDRLKDFIKNLITEMEADTYTDKPTIDEYKALSSMLTYLQRKNIPQLRSSVSEESSESIEKSQQLSRELERMMRLAEDTAKRERMSDVVSSASDSLDKARDLMDMLNQKDAAPKDIIKRLEKLRNLLDELRKSMRDFPQDLPEEFINRESVKSIDLNKHQDQLSDIMEALRTGDYEKAKELLNRMLQTLQGVLNTLQEAAGESHGKRRDKLIQRSDELQKKLESIVEKQRHFIDSTQEVKDFVDTVINSYEKVRMTELKDKFSILKSTAGIRLRDVDKEFAKGYLYRTPELLEKYIPKLKSSWKKRKVEEFIAELRYSPPDESFLDENQKSDLSLLSRKQNELKGEVLNVREGLSTLSHLTALLDMELLENLDLAGLYMGYASRSLSDLSPSEALPSERQALSYLIQSNNKMKSLAQKLQSIPQNIMLGMQTQYQQGQTGGEGGRTGFREGYVEIPGPGQEIGGKEFRRLILEALKEKHPEEYKRLIQEYFRSLGE